MGCVINKLIDLSLLKGQNLPCLHMICIENKKIEDGKSFNIYDVGSGLNPAPTQNKDVKL